MYAAPRKKVIENNLMSQILKFCCPTITVCAIKTIPKSQKSSPKKIIPLRSILTKQGLTFAISSVLDFLNESKCVKYVMVLS